MAWFASNRDRAAVSGTAANVQLELLPKKRPFVVDYFDGNGDPQKVEFHAYTIEDATEATLGYIREGEIVSVETARPTNELKPPRSFRQRFY